MHPGNIARKWMQNPTQESWKHAHPELKSGNWVNKQVMMRSSSGQMKTPLTSTHLEG